jgi:DNA-binding transcriptional regulator YhcF (GntR family)
MEKNIWEQLEEHINDNLGTYGLNMMDRFLDIKEIAEDLGLCPADTEERQTQLEQR